MIAKQIQFFGKDLEILTEDEQKAIKGGRRRRRRGNGQGQRNDDDDEVDPGCPPDYDE